MSNFYVVAYHILRTLGMQKGKISLILQKSLDLEYFMRHLLPHYFWSSAL